MPAIPELVGIHEIADLAGTTRQRAYQLSKVPSFPHPVAELGCGRIWTRLDVQRWLDQRDRRPGRPRRAEPLTP